MSAGLQRRTTSHYLAPCSHLAASLARAPSPPHAILSPARTLPACPAPPILTLTAFRMPTRPIDAAATHAFIARWSASTASELSPPPKAL